MSAHEFALPGRDVRCLGCGLLREQIFHDAPCSGFYRRQGEGGPMASHVFPPVTNLGDRCAHCGTLRVRTGQTVCPGPQRHGGPEALRPEPSRRVYASEDFDGINARVVELRAEDDAALNHIVHAEGEGGTQH